MGNPVGFTTHKRVGEPDYTQSINLFLFCKRGLGRWEGAATPFSDILRKDCPCKKRDFDIANRENLTIYKAAVLNLY